jgi:hypothetical protein
VWVRDAGLGNEIALRRYIVGAGWGTDLVFQPASSPAVDSLRLAVDLSGNALIVWIQSDGVRGNVWANRLAAGVSTSWGVATLIETDDTGSAGAPQVSFDASGHAHAVWHQLDSDRKLSIFANRYIAGTGWSAAAQIESDSSGNAQYPQIALDPEGNVTAVWSWDTGSLRRVFSNRFE